MCPRCRRYLSLKLEMCVLEVGGILEVESNHISEEVGLLLMPRSESHGFSRGIVGLCLQFSR